MQRVSLIKSLAYRQALTSVLVAFVIGLVLSATQVVYDWFQEKDRLERNIIQVMSTLEKPASQALYTVDRSLAGIVVDGLFEYKTVYKARLVDEFNDVYASKEKVLPEGKLRDLFHRISKSESEFRIPLHFGETERNVGDMIVSLDVYIEMYDFFKRAIMTFISGMFRNFALALCLIVVFNTTLVKPLTKLVVDIAKLRPGGEKRKVAVPQGYEESELGVLSDNANRIFELYEENARSLREVEKELRNQKSVLEETVEERTADLRQMNEKLALLSQTDALTGVANRRCFDETLHKEWGRLGRSGITLVLAMIDIDYFKDYNDTYGHQKGDECLRSVADLLQANAKRSGDLVARYGGEEFALILPITEEHEAVELCDKIRSDLEALQIPHSKAPLGYLTLSVGIASSSSETVDSVQSLIQQADQHLYTAKRSGKNQIVCKS